MRRGLILIIVLVLAGVCSLGYWLMRPVKVVVVYGGASVGAFQTVATLEESQEAVPFVAFADVRFETRSYISYVTAGGKGKARVTQSRPLDVGVVELTITFRLKTPTGHVLEFEPLKLDKGGVHNFTLILGPDEGVSGNGTFYLEIHFKLRVTPPAPTPVSVEREIVIVIEFNPATEHREVSVVRVT